MLNAFPDKHKKNPKLKIRILFTFLIIQILQGRFLPLLPPKAKDLSERERVGKDNNQSLWNSEVFRNAKFVSQKE